MCGGHSNPKRAYNRGTRTTGRIVFQGTSFSVDARGGGRYIWTGSPRLFGIGPLPIAGMMWGMRGLGDSSGPWDSAVSRQSVGWYPVGDRRANGVPPGFCHGPMSCAAFRLLMLHSQQKANVYGLCLHARRPGMVLQDSSPAPQNLGPRSMCADSHLPVWHPRLNFVRCETRMSDPVLLSIG